MKLCCCFSQILSAQWRHWFVFIQRCFSGRWVNLSECTIQKTCEAPLQVSSSTVTSHLLALVAENICSYVGLDLQNKSSTSAIETYLPNVNKVRQRLNIIHFKKLYEAHFGLWTNLSTSSVYVSYQIPQCKQTTSQ